MVGVKLRSARVNVAPRAVMTGVVLLLFGLTACSEELPTDYTAAHREAFLAACSRPVDDPRLLSDVCVCVYDRIEDQVAFNEFLRMSERLAGSVASTTAPAPDSADETGEVSAVVEDLPDDITRMVADCFTTEADL